MTGNYREVNYLFEPFLTKVRIEWQKGQSPFCVHFKSQELLLFQFSYLFSLTRLRPFLLNRQEGSSSVPNPLEIEWLGPCFRFVTTARTGGGDRQQSDNFIKLSKQNEEQFN